jgi:hypothetical protein
MVVSETGAHSSSWCMKILKLCFQNDDRFKSWYVPTFNTQTIVHVDDFYYSGMQTIQTIQSVVGLNKKLIGITYGFSSDAYSRIQHYLHTFLKNTNTTFEIYYNKRVKSIVDDTNNNQPKTPIVFSHKLADSVSTFIEYKRFLDITPPYKYKQKNNSNIFCMPDFILQYIPRIQSIVKHTHIGSS